MDKFVKYVIILMIKNMANINHIMKMENQKKYVIILKIKEYCEYKQYHENGELWNICNYIDGVKQS